MTVFTIDALAGPFETIPVPTDCRSMDYEVWWLLMIQHTLSTTQPIYTNFYSLGRIMSCYRQRLQGLHSRHRLFRIRPWLHCWERRIIPLLAKSGAIGWSIW